MYSLSLSLTSSSQNQSLPLTLPPPPDRAPCPGHRPNQAAHCLLSSTASLPPTRSPNAPDNPPVVVAHSLGPSNPVACACRHTFTLPSTSSCPRSDRVSISSQISFFAPSLGLAAPLVAPRRHPAFICFLQHSSLVVVPPLLALAFPFLRHNRPANSALSCHSTPGSVSSCNLEHFPFPSILTSCLFLPPYPPPFSSIPVL